MLECAGRVLYRVIAISGWDLATKTMLRLARLLLQVRVRDGQFSEEELQLTRPHYMSKGDELGLHDRNVECEVL